MGEEEDICKYAKFGDEECRCRACSEYFKKYFTDYVDYECDCSYAKFGIIYPTHSSKLARIYCMSCYRTRLDPEDFYDANGRQLATDILKLYLTDAKQFRENSDDIRDPYCSYCSDSLLEFVADELSYDRCGSCMRKPQPLRLTAYRTIIENLKININDAYIEHILKTCEPSVEYLRALCGKRYKIDNNFLLYSSKDYEIENNFLYNTRR